MICITDYCIQNATLNCNAHLDEHLQDVETGVHYATMHVDSIGSNVNIIRPIRNEERPSELDYCPHR